MATLSTQSSPSMAPVASPSLSSLKKVLSSRRRSSDLQNDAASQRAGIRMSLDSLEKSPSRKSTHSSPSRDDGSSKSGSSGMRKLLPGHAKRKRRRIRDEELKSMDFRGRSQDLDTLPPPSANRSTVSLSHSGSSLLTDDSEQDMYPAPPPFVSRDSHLGYLTSTSPLITTTTITDENSLKSASSSTFPAATDHNIPTFDIPEEASANASPHAHPLSDSTPVLPMPGLVDKADTLKPEADHRSIRRKSFGSSLRGVSPARKIRDVFSSGKSTKSPRTSPDRNYESSNGSANDLIAKTASISERRAAKFPDNPELPRVETQGDSQKFKATNDSLPSLETDQPPRTPPSATTATSLTTVVTPPTPTDVQHAAYNGSPRRNTTTSQPGDEQSRIVVSPTGNMISHRRSRSAASVSHQPSKLSNSILAPLTPTVEESKVPAEKTVGLRNITPGGSFFSSWVSAAQNAASTITNTINIQQTNRSRSGTGGSETKPGSASETIKEESPLDEEETPKKQLAVETLGSGDLDFTHLGLNNGMDEALKLSIRPDLEDLRKNSTVRRDEAAAKIEDMLAKRAVSQAYEKPTDLAQTPVAELPDPINSVRHTATFGSTLNGENTPPNGSIFDGETGSVKRNNSVRSRMVKRRSRGSSVATGHSTIGAALVSASTTTIANPAKGPTLSGFAIAPKQRNRNFHQQFRSVPEDDYLIEDYSCALQKEILLAGRIYISEGHVCFSSNILGWVTTLVISFEEVVSIERESTAMVFPNAIAIQTLHARHTFRSLLSREATYDLMIGIWKVSHPAAFKKSVNGKELMEQEASQEMAKENGEDVENGSEEEDDDDDDDDDDQSEDGDEKASFVGSDVSALPSATIEAKNLTRKPSAMNGAMPIATSAAIPASAEIPPSAVVTTSAGDAQVDYPGPSIHGPTDCTDSSTHYERIVKDEVIPAPLGKIYNLLYGPASGSFLRKYLLEEQKVMELVLEDDKKGLSNEIKSRQYTYIKPLGGSIGPKQTKCITTENLDFFDLERSVSVTCTTQTPDVPSGNAFSVKTRYCLSWAPGNATRLQMNCGIEWTAKSWLKGPIEKGANDGQQVYGDGLVKILKSGLARPRAATAGSKGAKSSKKKKKGDRGDRAKEREAEATKKKDEDWGIFEPARGVLGPIITVFQPVMNGYVATTVIVVLVLLLWFRRPSGNAVGYAGGFAGPAERFAAYDEMWRKEESELWNWLEERAGVDILRDGPHPVPTPGKKQAARRKLSDGKNAEARLREEKMEEREIEEAIRVTQERLKVLQQAVERKKQSRGV